MASFKDHDFIKSVIDYIEKDLPHLIVYGDKDAFGGTVQFTLKCKITGHFASFIVDDRMDDIVVIRRFYDTAREDILRRRGEQYGKTYKSPTYSSYAASPFLSSSLPPVTSSSISDALKNVKVDYKNVKIECVEEPQKPKESVYKDNEDYGLF